MRTLSENLPYLLLGAVALVVLFQLIGPYMPLRSLVAEDIVGQLAHWVSGGTTMLTITEPAEGGATDSGSPASTAAAVVAYEIVSDWWSLDTAEREREAGKFLAVLLDAAGKFGVDTWGVSGLGLQGSSFAVVLEHPDPLELRRVVRQLTVLPVSRWFRQETIFYGESTTVSPPLADGPSEQATGGGEYALLVLEARSRDWFLLSGEKQAQLLEPRINGLSSASVSQIRSYKDLGFGPYSDLTIVAGLELGDIQDLRALLRSHWEQKYVEETRVYVGPRLSATELMDSVR